MAKHTMRLLDTVTSKDGRTFIRIDFDYGWRSAGHYVGQVASGKVVALAGVRADTEDAIVELFAKGGDAVAEYVDAGGRRYRRMATSGGKRSFTAREADEANAGRPEPADAATNIGDDLAAAAKKESRNANG